LIYGRRRVVSGRASGGSRAGGLARKKDLDYPGRPDPFARFLEGDAAAGFVTTAAASAATVWKMQAVTRHKTLDVLSGYVRDAEAFKDHAGQAFL
jgi:hypothetical protein